MILYSHPVVDFLSRRRTQYLLAWLLVLGIAIARIWIAHISFQEDRAYDDPNRRVDGNRGHTTIDFAGQWLMGRMLVCGYGQQLYHRYRQYELAQQSFPLDQESPTATDHDADNLLGWFVGEDDPEWAKEISLHLAPVASSDPWQQMLLAISSQSLHDPNRLTKLMNPKQSPGIGGPLYPPIHALVMAPLAWLVDQPQPAYFVNQWFMLAMGFLGGWAVSYMSNGRIWLPLAASLIFVYSGFRGGINLGQNSPLTTALILWGWAWIVRGHPILGGITLGCLAFKPVWAVSFFVALLFLRQWRAVFCMGGTGVFAILISLPFVGVHSWLDWLSIGKEAAQIYNIDVNWISLSRDVLGIPRRFFTDFDLPRSKRENLLAFTLSWMLWAVVIEFTIRIYWLRKDRTIPTTGPLPALIFATAWMCTYHFMYYDAVISILVFFVLWASPEPLFPNKTLQPIEQDTALSNTKPRTTLYVNSFAWTLLVGLLLLENILAPLKLQMSGVVEYGLQTISKPDGSTRFQPMLVLGTSDRYPWETIGIMLLWLYCAWRVLTETRRNTNKPNRA